MTEDKNKNDTLDVEALKKELLSMGVELKGEETEEELSALFETALEEKDAEELKIKEDAEAEAKLKLEAEAKAKEDAKKNKGSKKALVGKTALYSFFDEDDILYQAGNVIEAGDKFFKKYEKYFEKPKKEKI